MAQMCDTCIALCVRSLTLQCRVAILWPLFGDAYNAFGRCGRHDGRIRLKLRTDHDVCGANMICECGCDTMIIRDAIIVSLYCLIYGFVYPQN